MEDLARDQVDLSSNNNFKLREAEEPHFASEGPFNPLITIKGINQDQFHKVEILTCRIENNFKSNHVPAECCGISTHWSSTTSH